VGWAIPMRPGSDTTVPWLVRLLRAADYRTESRTFGLLAHREADGRTLLWIREAVEPRALEGAFPAGSRHRVLVWPEEPKPSVRAQAAELGWELVPADRATESLGGWLLPAEKGDAASIAAALEPSEGSDGSVPWAGRVVRPRIGRADAERLARVEGLRVTLRLVPFYVASYRFRPPDGSDPSGNVRLVAVHSLSGRVEVWDADDRDFALELDEPHQPLEPALDEARLRAHAERALRERHTHVFDHTEQSGGAIVVERRKWVPGPKDLGIGPGAFVRVPYWYIEGPDGRVVLDAVTGRTLGRDERE
jgi:hypothetical protein